MFKDRLCSHGDKDFEKENIRCGLANAHLDIIRLLLLFTATFRKVFRCADIKGAYFLSGSITGELYVRPPRE